MEETGIQFKYTEKRSIPEKKFDNIFIKKFEALLKYIDVDRIIGIQRITNFSLFVNTLLHTIYGYVDDGHSYLFDNGIMAVTINGVHQ